MADVLKLQEFIFCISNTIEMVDERGDIYKGSINEPLSVILEDFEIHQYTRFH